MVKTLQGKTKSLGFKSLFGSSNPRHLSSFRMWTQYVVLQIKKKIKIPCVKVCARLIPHGSRENVPAKMRKNSTSVRYSLH